MSADEILGRRALNRALLARQLLLERAPMPALDALEHLVGLQAQAPGPPYVGLWTRLEGFDPAELADLILNRGAVRIALQRGTIHAVSATDALTLRPLLQPLFDRWLGQLAPRLAISPLSAQRASATRKPGAGLPDSARLPDGCGRACPPFVIRPAANC